MVAVTFLIFSFKELIITSRTSNVCFARFVLTEKSLNNKIDSCPCLKLCEYMNGWMRKYILESTDILIRLDNKTIYP